MSIEFTQPGYIYVWKQTPEGDIYVSRHLKQEEATESVFRHVEANGDGDYRIETPDRFVKVKYVVFKRPATEPPSAPTGLVILSLDAGTAVLDWNNNPEPNVTSYRVYYSQNGISFELYSSPGTSTATVTGLAPAITHFFKVAAYNSAGQESAFSSTVSGQDTVPPAIPTGLLVVPGSITGNQLALDWNNNTDADFAYYRVYQSTNQSTWTNVSGDITNSVHVAINLISETTYYFQVAATDTSGNESARSPIVSGTTLDITAPANATNFAILESSTTASTMFMTWTASVSSDIAGYKIYRSTDDVTYSLVATLGLVTNYEDTGLTANTLYYYKISAIDEVPNESALSAADSYTTLTEGLTWISDSVPFPITIAAGGTVDLEQYITDIAQLGNIESIGTALPSGVTIESTPTWRLTATSGATLGTTSGHQLKLIPSAEADWQTRASAAGVIWAHDFRTDAEVDSFRWENGKGDDPGRVSPGAAELIRQTSDGIAGTDGACIEITRGLGLGNQQLWWRPFSPSAVGNGSAAIPGGLNVFAGPNQYPGASAISNWNHGNVVNINEAGGSERISGDIYFSFRMKLDPRIIQNGYIGTDFGGKILYVSRTEASLVAQEVIMQTGEQTPPTAADVHLVQFNRYLDYRAMLSNTAQPGSITANQKQPGSSLLPTLVQYPYGEWRSYMFHFVAGRENDGLSGQFWDSQIQLYQCADGDTAWTKIWDVQTYGFDFQNSYTKGWNAIILSNFHNAGYDGNPFWMRWTQCILSTQWINPPST